MMTGLGRQIDLSRSHDYFTLEGDGVPPKPPEGLMTPARCAVPAGVGDPPSWRVLFCIEAGTNIGGPAVVFGALM